MIGMNFVIKAGRSPAAGGKASNGPEDHCECLKARRRREIFKSVEIQAPDKVDTFLAENDLR